MTAAASVGIMVQMERRLRFGTFARIPTEHMRYLVKNPASRLILRMVISRLITVFEFGPVTKAAPKNGIWFITGGGDYTIRSSSGLVLGFFNGVLALCQDNGSAD